MKMRHTVVSLGFFVVSLSVFGLAAPGLAQERAVVVPASPDEARQQAGGALRGPTPRGLRSATRCRLSPLVQGVP